MDNYIVSARKYRPDTFDTVVMKIERIFEMINKEFTAMEEEIQNLRKEVKEIRDNYTGKEGCDEW